MCCGRKSYSTTVTLASKTINIADDGVSKVEYVGSRTPGETFNTWGFYTLTQYRVTPGKVFTVDNRDLVDNTSKKAGILQQLEGNKAKFILVEEEEIVEVVKEKETLVTVQDFSVNVKDAEAIVELLSENDVEDTDAPGYFSLVDTTAGVAIKNIKKSELADSELDLLYTYEYAGTEDGSGGKNRVTVLKAIEDAKSS